MTTWAVEKFGDDKIFVKKNQIGKGYCPQCVRVERKTRIIKKLVQYRTWYGALRTRTDLEEQSYNFRSHDVMKYKDKQGNTYCGKCKHMIGIALRKGRRR